MPEPPRRPTLTPQAEADRRARQAREAAALRDNLRKRKEQLRARTAGAAKPEADDPSDEGDDR